MKIGTEPRKKFVEGTGKEFMEETEKETSNWMGSQIADTDIFELRQTKLEKCNLGIKSAK